MAVDAGICIGFVAILNLNRSGRGLFSTGAAKVSTSQSQSHSCSFSSSSSSREQTSSANSERNQTKITALEQRSTTPSQRVYWQTVSSLLARQAVWLQDHVSNTGAAEQLPAPQDAHSSERKQQVQLLSPTEELDAPSSWSSFFPTQSSQCSPASESSHDRQR